MPKGRFNDDNDDDFRGNNDKLQYLIFYPKLFHLTACIVRLNE